jgi:hypothetical protein
MQDTILPSTTPEFPQVTRSAWQRIRKPLTWIIVGAVIVAGAIALMFAGSGPVTPTSILKGDGYTLNMTFTHQQLVQAMNQGGGTSGLNPGDYFTTAAAGLNSGQEEVVLGVTSQGQGLDALLVPMLNGQSGVHAKTVDGGKFIVVSGSTGALGGLSNLGTSTSSKTIV